MTATLTFSPITVAPPSGPPSFSGVTIGSLIGAGGWCTHISFANDGTAYARCDTYGAWRLDPSAANWVSIVPGGIAYPWSDGAYEIATCPSNSSYACGIFDGAMYYSSNKGATFTAATGFATVSGAVNGTTQTYYQSPRIACDPASTNNWIAVAPANGAYYSTDAGHTWTHIAAITTPSGTANGIVVFDPTGPIYVFSSGTGWYKSTAGVSGTFTLTTSTPTNSTGAACDISNGTLYAVSGSTTVEKFNGSTWSSSTAPVSAWGVATDPATAGRAVVMEQQPGKLGVTTNSGTSWSSASATASSASGVLSVPWIVNTLSTMFTQGAFVGTSSLAFNPNASNELWMTNGISVNKCNPNNAPNTTAPIWTDCSLGIENMVVNKIISPPGSGPITAQWDRSASLITNPDSPPSAYLPVEASVGSLDEAYSVDWVTGASNIIVTILSTGSVQGSPGSSGISTDGLNTFAKFSSQTPFLSGNGAGGSIIASSASDIAWASGGFNSTLDYTTNGGTTWTAPTGISGTWGPNYYDYPENVLCQDRVTATTFYGVNSGGTVFKSTNSGATWTSLGSPGFSITAWCQMYTVPGQGGHLFFSGAARSSSTGTGFYFSLNGGTSWNTVPTVTSVSAFGFGAIYPGQSYPTIYVNGYLSGVYGIYRCTNFVPSTRVGTWTFLATHPNGNVDYVSALTGDTDVFGWAYIGHVGSGGQRLVSNDAAPWVKPIVPLPGATVSGTQTLTALAASEIAYSSVVWQIDGSQVATGLSTSYNVSGLASGAHTLSVVTTGNGQTATVSIPIVK